VASVPQTAVLIVAAGSGSRAGSSGIPKQYQSIGGQPILARTLGLFVGHDGVDAVQAVIGERQRDLYDSVVAPHPKLRSPITGGRTRQSSVQLGLAALANDAPRRVLIHDAARPFASSPLIDRVMTALGAADAVVPTLPVASTLKRVELGHVLATVERDGLEAAETPQGFAFAAIRDAHEKAAAAGREFTDDAAVAEWAGIAVTTVAGDPANVKLTTADDIVAADRRSFKAFIRSRRERRSR